MARIAYVIVDLGWGDSGKGTITDAICRKTGASLVVRFSGGPNAGHRVVTDDGRSHVFSSFGAGTLAGADTYLSEHVLVDPFALMKEAEALDRLWVGHGAQQRLTIHRDCLVITPFHRALNRAREVTRLGARHGSCGVGVGETIDWALSHPDTALRVGDCFGTESIGKLSLLWQQLQAEFMRFNAVRYLEWPFEDEGFTMTENLWLLGKAYLDFATKVQIVDGSWLRQRTDEVIVCEGAQGVLLDETHGFPPHTTWSTCTPKNALEVLAAGAPDAKVVKVGVTRAYATRHGPGPFPTEERTFGLDDVANGDHPWQGPFRVGRFDLVLFRYALKVCGGMDVLAVTHVDRLHGPVHAAYGYTDWRGFQAALPIHASPTVQAHLGAFLSGVAPAYLTWANVENFLQKLASECPVGIVSRGPTAADKTFLRDAGGEWWSSPTTAKSTVSNSVG